MDSQSALHPLSIPHRAEAMLASRLEASGPKVEHFPRKDRPLATEMIRPARPSMLPPSKLDCARGGLAGELEMDKRAKPTDQPPCACGHEPGAGYSQNPGGDHIACYPPAHRRKAAYGSDAHDGPGNSMGCAHRNADQGGSQERQGASGLGAEAL